MQSQLQRILTRKLKYEKIPMGKGGIHPSSLKTNPEIYPVIIEIGIKATPIILSQFT